MRVHDLPPAVRVRLADQVAELASEGSPSTGNVTAYLESQDPSVLRTAAAFVTATEGTTFEERTLGRYHRLAEVRPEVAQVSATDKRRLREIRHGAGQRIREMVGNLRLAVERLDSKDKGTVLVLCDHLIKRVPTNRLAGGEVAAKTARKISDSLGGQHYRATEERDRAEIQRCRDATESIVKLMSASEEWAPVFAPEELKTQVGYTAPPAVELPVTEGSPVMSADAFSAVVWNGIELLKETPSSKEVCINSDSLSFVVTWDRTDASWQMNPKAVMRGEGQQHKVELSAPLVRALTEATLATSAVKKVVWRRGDRLQKVELTQGGFAYLRRESADSRGLLAGPGPEIAFAGLAEHFGFHGTPATVGMPDENGDLMSVSAENSGFQSFMECKPGSAAARDGRLNRLDVLDLIANNTDRNPNNVGLAGEDVIAIDGESCFDRSIQRFRHYSKLMQGVRPSSLDVPSDLLEQLKATTRDDLTRILAGGKLSDKQIGMTHDRISFLLHLAGEHGQIPLDQWSNQEFEKFLLGQS